MGYIDEHGHFVPNNYLNRNHMHNHREQHISDNKKLVSYLNNETMILLIIFFSVIIFLFMFFYNY